MLRRKFLLIFGLVVALLVATAVGAVWTLQSLLGDLHHINREAWAVMEDVNDLANMISRVEIELYQLEVGGTRHLDGLIDAVEAMQTQLEKVGRSYVPNLTENHMALESLRVCLPEFTRHITVLGTAQDPEVVTRHRQRAMATALVLRRDILALSRNVRAHGEAEQTDLTVHFRWLVLGLTVVFLLVINVSIVVLLRMATMVVKPVEKLLEATRQLAQERFEYRVRIEQKDEFDQLARAFNSLAEQLQTNERRKLEMLGQVALTLNHELNNAIEIIELQLALLSRQAAGNRRIEKCARQIHESLDRMTRTVEALKRVRRIVLTDYVEGVKMLDLERSVDEEQADVGAPGVTGNTTES